MIDFDGVSKAYEGGRSAVRNLSLSVPTGTLQVLIGPSGCGKTTALSMINRLVEPSAGTIAVDGEDVRSLDPVALRRRIGFVFQGIGLFPHLSVAENIAITPRLLGWVPDRIEARIVELMDLMQLEPARYRVRLPRELSGGQQQRVGLARALAAGPRIMLMDEPFGALDPLTRDDLATEYRAIHDRLGLTTVLVTHDMTEALLLADRIAVMREGSLVQSGTPRELLAAPADGFVRSLIETPRRRTRRLAEVLQEAAPP